MSKPAFTSAHFDLTTWFCNPPRAPTPDPLASAESFPTHKTLELTRAALPLGFLGPIPAVQ